MNNKLLTRFALVSSVLIFGVVLLRNRSIVVGMVPRLLKEAVKANALYRAGMAAVNRMQIATLIRKGELFTPAPTPAEAARLLSRWEAAGKPLPGPGIFKQNVLRSYGQAFGLTTLVETGTFTGDTPAALKDAFRRIYSVELNAELVRRVRTRFQGDPHITILHGDSEKHLPEILQEISQPTLFWLDGHYSGGITALGNKVTPILGELEAVLSHGTNGHVILIDDARDFRHDKGHPTLNELQAFIVARRPELRFEVQDDIVRLTPAEPVQ